ncbi:hypothetical protein DSM106972_094870 [Dulcicalothrix desertica PCC 7102]|uniref:Uncharacterized protein n=2 Tax=Dulcicalothrix desertica TaxID=32056 RepID=A0A3S1C269_9CYAN|nr:hypothetical protein DSM106972_094870 [Dulcicalothrix desertica PCC 7102]TWH62715.1 hypothetical protein CAL7102_00232 [Dulcicalothrix desertica PCC 7102]
MSNGRTDVVLAVLVTSGSRLALSPREAELVLWLAQRDQSKVGFGMVGFDLSEIPWTLENFDEEKAFMLKIIEGAQAKLGWNVLDFGTPPDVLCGDLEQIHMLVLNLTAEDLIKAPQMKIKHHLNTSFDEQMAIELNKCEKHGVLLTEYGCFVCNNLP